MFDTWKAPVQATGYQETTNLDGVIGYYGTVNWGESNHTSKADASCEDTKLGKVKLRWTGNVDLYDNMGQKIDGEKADLVMTIEPTVYLGERPSTIKKATKVYIPVLTANNTDYFGLSAYNPRTDCSLLSSAIQTDIRYSDKVTYEIMETGTNTPISADDFPVILFGTRDIDAKDRTIKSSASDAAKGRAAYAEAVLLNDGFSGDIFTTENPLVEIGEKDGNQWIHPDGDVADIDTINSGFVISAAPQKFTFTWRGSSGYNSAVKDGKKLPGRSMGTRFTSFSQLLMVDPVEINYVWADGSPDNPAPELPAGEDEWLPGNEYTVSEQYQIDEKYTDSNGKAWIFKGWEVANEDEDSDEDAQTVNPGDKLTIEKVTTFVGSWTPDAPIPHKITTEVVNGTITPSDDQVPDGSDKVIEYAPKDGYKLVSVTVDGEDVDITDYPTSYEFTNVTKNHEINVVYEKEEEPENPNVSLIKSVSDPTPEEGDEIEYTIEATLLNNDQTADTDTAVTAGIFADDDEEPDPDVINDESDDADNTDNTDNADNANDSDNADDATAGDNASDGTDDQSTVDDEQANTDDNEADSDKTTKGHSVVITDELPAGIEYVDGTLKTTGDNVSSAKVENGKLVVEVPDFTNKVTITFNAIVTCKNGTVVNTAVLESDDFGNAEDDAVIEVGDSEDDDIDEPEITKTVSKKKVKVGDTVTYKVKVSSDELLKNAEISDELPKGLKLVKNSIKCSIKGGKAKVNGNSFTVSFKELEGDVTITYKAKAKKSGKYTNIAFLDADNLDEPIADDATVKISGGNGGNGHGPKTGDTKTWIMYGVVLGLAVGVAAYYIKRRKGQKK